MNGTSRSAGWDDLRVTAAFAARAAAGPATPPDLVAAVIERLARDPRAGTRPRTTSFIAAAAAVILVLGVGGVAIMTLSNRPPAASTASPGPSASGPIDGSVVRPEPLPSGPTATDPAAAMTFFGMPIITVAEAMDHRDQHLDDTELVVRGFGWAPGLMSCPAVVPDSPARAQCPSGFTWLAQVAPQNARFGPSMAVPLGPAINLLIRDETAMGIALDNQPRDVLVVGHFDDHRASLCTDSIVDACRRNFLVDAIVNSTFLGYTSIPLQPFDPLAFNPKDEPPVVAAKEQVERIAGEGRARAVRALFTIFAVSGPLLRSYEPGAQAVPALTSAKAVWIVRFLDDVAGRDVVRTKLIVDGTFVEMSANVYEATAAGVQLFVATGTPPPTTGRPTVVLDLNVIGVADALVRDPRFGKEELAVHGWFVTPDPAAACPGLHDEIRPVRPPACFEARSWLLEQPEDLWSDPAKVGIDRQPSGATLNPIIPSDVPFDVPNMWSGTSPTPVEVVVVGHFSDPRVTETYAGNEYFVVDELAWQGGHALAPASIVRLTAGPTEPTDAVITRVVRELGAADQTWLTVIDGSDLATVDPDAATGAPELADAAVVWVIRRLVTETVDDRPIRVVATAFTADGSDRLWYEPRTCCGLDLATTIDVELPAIGAGRGTVEIADHIGSIVTARAVSPDDYQGWKPVGPAEGWWLEIAPGSAPHELAIRWKGNRCDTTWELTVLAGPWLDLSWPSVDGCAPTDGTPRAIVLTFDHPIDFGRVTANDNTSGG